MNEQPNDMMALLQRMQQQLVYLEKKIDTLLQQSQQPKPFNRERSSFSKPFRPYNRPDNRPDRPQGAGPSRSGHGNFSHKKKPFFRGKERG